MEDFAKREYTLDAGSLLVLGTGYLVEGDLTPVREIKTGEDGDFWVVYGEKVFYDEEVIGAEIGTDTASFTVYRAEKKTTVKTTEGSSGHATFPSSLGYFSPDKVRMARVWDDWKW